MKLRTVLGDINFKIPTGNNFYNSTGWFLMTKEYLIKYMKMYYGNREVLDGFLDPAGKLPSGKRGILRSGRIVIHCPSLMLTEQHKICR